MTHTELPGPVKQFLLDHIDSIPELEALLLARMEPGTHWQAATLAARLYVDTRTATAVLDALERRGLLRRGEDGFSYGPRTPELEAAVEALTDAHRRLLIAVTGTIHSKTRTALRDFADAFRLREEK
jgi:DNA-binding MarR family transcriptional regulator